MGGEGRGGRAGPPCRGAGGGGRPPYGAARAERRRRPAPSLLPGRPAGRGTQGPLDALCARLRAVTAGRVSEAEALTRLSRSPHGVGGPMAPVTQLRLPSHGGDRTRALAQSVLPQVVEGWAPGCRPLGLPAGCQEYTTARRPHYGPWGPPPAAAPGEAGPAAALCAGGADQAAAPAGPGESARGLGPPPGRHAGRSGLRWAAPASRERAGHSGKASAWGRRGAAGHPARHGRGRVASAARPVPWLRQLRLATGQLTPAPAPVPRPQRHGLREARAALHTGAGRGAA